MCHPVNAPEGKLGQFGSQRGDEADGGRPGTPACIVGRNRSVGGACNREGASSVLLDKQALSGEGGEGFADGRAAGAVAGLQLIKRGQAGGAVVGLPAREVFAQCLLDAQVKRLMFHGGFKVQRGTGFRIASVPNGASRMGLPITYYKA